MIRKFLDLSTSHIPDADRAWLCEQADLNNHDGGDVESHHVAAHSCGWWMWAGTDDTYGIPEGLMPVCLHARANGCDYILFDRDAEVIGALPVYEW